MKLYHVYAADGTLLATGRTYEEAMAKARKNA